MATDLLKTLVKTGSIKDSALLNESDLFNDKDLIPTNIPIINIAFSGDVDGGMTSGLTVLAGESKTFKTMLALYCLKAYQEQYPDSVCLFYDCEYGVTPQYLKTFGIDDTRVIHIPIGNVEELKFDIVKKLDAIRRGDKVFILVDSIGAMASKKEVEDAVNEKSVADMTRAKAIRSLLRIATPQIVKKDVTCFLINHVYQEQGLFPKVIIPGGCVTAGTGVIMDDNTIKPIEDIIVGDFVNTITGPKEVTHIWDKDTLEEGVPECIELIFEDGYAATVSESHKFLVSVEDEYKWVAAKDLDEYMNIITL